MKKIQTTVILQDSKTGNMLLGKRVITIDFKYWIIPVIKIEYFKHNVYEAMEFIKIFKNVVFDTKTTPKIIIKNINKIKPWSYGNS